jgi:hypothetical protein
LTFVLSHQKITQSNEEASVSELNPVRFLLNQGPQPEAAAVVKAPAFSITKVLSAAAIIVGPIAAVVVDKVKADGLSTHDYVVLAVALLAFLAITASADVIARAVASAAATRAEANAALIAQFTPFKKPLPGRRVETGADVPVEILASAIDYFLVREDGDLRWQPASKIVVP